MWGMGLACAMGNSEGPQSTSWAASCSDPCRTDPGHGVEMIEGLASFFQGVGRVPVLPGWGTVAQPRPHLRLLPAGGWLWSPGRAELSPARFGGAPAIHPAQGWVARNSEEENALSGLDGSSGIFGVVQSRVCGPCGSKYL